MLEQGKVLQNRYRIERQIGQGGMGSVYLATDSRFNNTVAIKETVIADDNFRKALKREARLLNSLKHVALPKVSDHFIEDNGQYIVMEYIAGEDLHEMMERSGQAFPIEDVLIWAEQLLDALEYLHGQENPIIHRDIKPQNLKLTPQGQIILLDFGLAKGNPTDANHKTAANSIFGYSRHYASLEQIQGTGTDPRSDIYSLAATLYHLTTGKPPADALTRVMNVMNEESDPLLPANAIHQQVDDHLSHALLRCMSLNANLRPQSAAEMYQLLFSEEKTVVTQKTKASEASVAVPGDFSTQNTKVFPEGGTGKPSEIETEVMSADRISGAGYEARNTAAPGGEGTHFGGMVTNSGNRRRRMAAAAGALSLLLVGSIAALVYYGDTGFAGSPDSTVPEVKAPEQKAAVDIQVPGESNSESPIAEETTETAAAAEETQSAPQETTAKAPSKGIGTGSKKTATVVFPEGFDPEQFKLLEKELGEDFEFTVRDKARPGERVVFDEKGILIRPNQPGVAPIRVPLDRENLKQLTPAQRRDLRKALDLQRRANEDMKRLELEKVSPAKPPPPPAPPETSSSPDSN